MIARQFTDEKIKKKEFVVYSGLDSFDDDSLDRELDLLKEMGIDSQKLKDKYNPLQLSEIRKGLADKLDVNQYLNPKLSWLDMEEIRLELFHGIDMTEYRKQGFDTQQIFQIRKGLVSGIDVAVYAKKDYLAEQMRELRKGLVVSEDFPVIFYLDPAFDHLQMREIRRGLEAQIDVSNYAYVNIPYMKMRVIRESAEDGLVFDKDKINKYSSGILNQLHNAYKDNIDISRYIKEGYDSDQIEEISICLKEEIPIDQYISVNMRADAIREIRLGIENGIIVDDYANEDFNWQQMKEIRLGLEHQIDVSLYCNVLYWADQMREIRIGLEEGLDVSKFSSFMYTAKDMRRIKEKIISGEYFDLLFVNEQTENYEDMGSEQKKQILENMLANRAQFLELSHGNMLCWFTLPPKTKKGLITDEIIYSFLKKCNIKYGIDEDAIIEASKHPGKKYLVASGVDCVNGIDGYYEYCFDVDNSLGYTIDDEGNADFSNMDSVIEVNVGTVVAIYHKATAGTDGCDVFGNVKTAKRGHEIPILKGDGFMIMNDRVTYVAKYKGALTFKDGEINIQKLTVMPEVKMTDKIVRCEGVLLVKGDVESGSEIHATGDVIVSGHVTSSFISSGGNIIIKGGATCPVRGGIDAKGNVSAKYLERVNVKANNVFANSMVNCEIVAKETIKTLGKDGVVYGGNLQSSYGFEAANVGSKGGAKTVINLGLIGEFQSTYNHLKKELLREQEEFNTLNTERERLQELGAVNREMMQWKIKINAAVGVKERNIKELKHKLNSMDVAINNSNNARAVITDNLYSGVVFIMSGVVHKIEKDEEISDRLVLKVDSKHENIVMV